MRLVPYGPMFAAEVADLIARRGGEYLKKYFIPNPSEFACSVALSQSQSYLVLLDGEVVKGVAMYELQGPQRGTCSYPIIHNLVAEPGYGRIMFRMMFRIFEYAGYNRAMVWLGSHMPSFERIMKERYGMEEIAKIGIVDVARVAGDQDG